MTRRRGLGAWILVVGAVWTAPAMGATGWTAAFDYGLRPAKTAMATDGTAAVFGALPVQGGSRRGAVQVRPPGRPLLAPQVLAAEPVFGSDIVAGPAGGILAAWVINGNVYTAVMKAGDTAFGAPAKMPQDNPVAKGPVRVDLDAAGVGHVAWITDRGNTMDVRYATLPAGGGQPGPSRAVVTAASSTGNNLNLELEGFGVSDAGRPVVVSSTGNYDSSYKYSKGRLDLAVLPGAGGGSTHYTQLDGTNDAALKFVEPELTVDPAGGIAVVWERRTTAADGSSFTSALRMRRGSVDALGPEEDPAAGGGSNPRFPSLAADDRGGLRLAWLATTTTGTVPQTRVQTRMVGPGSEAGPIQSFGSTAVAPTAAEVRVGAGGQAMLVMLVEANDSCTYRGTFAAASELFPASATLGAPLPASMALCAPPLASVGATGDGIVAITVLGETAPPGHGIGLDGAPPRLLDLAIPGTLTTGLAGAFSVRAIDTWSPVTLGWDFGDGASAAGASAEHAYGSAGERGVTVTATDALGNTTSAGGAVTVANPPPPAAAGPDATVSGTAAAADLVPPRLSKLRVVKRRLVFALDEAATVRITVRRRGKVVRRLTRPAAAGANRVKLPRRLRAGRHRAVLIATDAAGNRSAAASVRFRVRAV